MILKSFQFEKKILEKNKYFLFYGSNKGLIQDTVKNTTKHIAEEKIYRYEESEVIKNTETFLEDILNMSFFENEKFIIINRTTDKLYKIIKDTIEKKINGISILLISDGLEKKSKLRNFFEKKKI